MTFFMSFWVLLSIASLLFGGSAYVQKRLYPKESVKAYWVVYIVVVIALVPLLFRGGS